MRLDFVKMQGLGNDFVILDGVSQQIDINAARVQQLSHRKLGVGCDQLLLLEPPLDPDVDFFYRIFNADGHEVGQCGNGARCLAQFIRQQQLSLKNQFIVQTKDTKMTLKLLDNNQAEVQMPAPVFHAADVPVCTSATGHVHRLLLPGDVTIDCVALSVGNPHAVIFVDDVARAQVQPIGSAIQASDYFPEGVNVGFCEIVNTRMIKLRVYERGAGETFACGSGACAAVVAGQKERLLNADVKVALTGGELTICWQGKGASIRMTGSATTVFRGSIEYD